MKTSSLPPLRVSDELRQEAQAVLLEGETLSSMVLDAVSRNIEYRKARSEFIARGLASSAAAQATGEYIPARKVIQKLRQKLSKAKRRAPANSK